MLTYSPGDLAKKCDSTNVSHFHSQVPFAVAFTKCDARKRGGPTPAANAAAFKTELLRDYETLPACFETSSAKGQGRVELLSYLASLRALDATQGSDFL